MKKLTILFIIFCSIGFGQNKEIDVSMNDFKVSNGKAILIKDVNLKNGEGDYIDVNTFISLPESLINREFGINRIIGMIEEANAEAMLSAKNKYTYIPRKISAFINKDDAEKIIFSVEFSAQNDYGATKSGQNFYVFSDLGVLLEKY